MDEKCLKSILHAKIRHAKKRGIEFKLSEAEFQILIECTGTNCPMCNCVYKPRPDGRNFQMPSLDRIDHLKPYESGNCRIICVSCNSSKGVYERTIDSSIAEDIVMRNKIRVNTPFAGLWPTEENKN